MSEKVEAKIPKVLPKVRLEASSFAVYQTFQFGRLSLPTTAATLEASVINQDRTKLLNYY